METGESLDYYAEGIQICPRPIDIEARTVSGLTPEQAVDVTVKWVLQSVLRRESSVLQKVFSPSVNLSGNLSLFCTTTEICNALFVFIFQKWCKIRIHLQRKGPAWQEVWRLKSLFQLPSTLLCWCRYYSVFLTIGWQLFYVSLFRLGFHFSSFVHCSALDPAARQRQPLWNRCKGDFLSALQRRYGEGVCREPLYIEAVTMDKLTPAVNTRQNFHM